MKIYKSIVICLTLLVVGGIAGFEAARLKYRHAPSKDWEQTWQAFDTKKVGWAHDLYDDGWGAYSELKIRLHSENPELRRRSALFLGDWANAVNLIPLYLIPLLDDPNEDVRFDAAHALAQWGYLPALEFLADRTAADQKDSAVWILGGMCPEGPPKASTTVTPDELATQWKNWLRENLDYLRWRQGTYVVDQDAKKQGVPALFWGIFDAETKDRWSQLSESEKMLKMQDAASKAAQICTNSALDIYAASQEQR